MIRGAVEGDARRLAEIFVAAWHSGYRGVVADDVIESLDIDAWTTTFAEQLRSGRFRAAVWSPADGQPLGFTLFGADPDAQRPGIGYLASLYVDPSAGGRGIGRALLDHALSDMTASGYGRQTLWVFAGNHRARKLYQDSGFRATGERCTDPRWGAEQLRYARGGADGQTATPKSLAMPVSPDA